MKVISWREPVITLCFLALVLQFPAAAQEPRAPSGAVNDLPSSSKGISRIFSQFQPQETAPLNLENSPRLESRIRDGKLELTLADAIALALENNLDIAVQRFIPQYAQTDLLRAQSGQSPRGFTGGSIPGGLTAGALGAGVTGATSGSGVGSAGGISGGGGAVQVGSTGNFDPSFSMNFSWDRTTSPLNTIQVSGIPNVTGQTTALTSSYAQLLHMGTSFSFNLSGQRQSSTQQYLRFNPAFVSRFSFGINQPLLNGFGYLANERYIIVARNNTRVSREVFRLQVINALVTVQNAYWDLAAMQETVRVAEQSLSVSSKLLEDNKTRLEIGTMSPLDVVAAQSEVAARTRDLTVARTNLQVQEATLKNILSKRVSPELNAARIVLLDRMPEPRDADLPELESALAGAMESRPDLRQAERNLENQDIALRFTDNSLMPDLAIFGFLAGAGLQGEGAQADTSIWDSLQDSFTLENPEYAGGVTISIPIKNRQAQADSLRAQLEGKQQRIGLQRSRNQVALEVRKALIGMIQGKAQVEAAHQAVRLAREIHEGEKERLLAGASTSYQVILRERDLRSAELAEVNAMATYAKAMVEMDRARGATLERNGIELEDALNGTVSRMPVVGSLDSVPRQEVK